MSFLFCYPTMMGLNFVYKGAMVESLNFILTVSKYAGVRPCTLQNSKISLSTGFLIWSIFILLLLGFSYVYMAFQSDPFDGHTQGGISKSTFMILAIVQITSGYGTVLISLFWIITSKTSIQEAIVSAEIVQKILPPFECKVHVVQVFFCSFSLVVLSVLYFIAIESTSLYNITINIFRFNVPIIMTYFIIFDYTSTLSVVKQMFSLLNTKVKKSWLSDIHLYVDCYDRLALILESVNNLFGPQLLLIIVSNFVLITNSIYMCYCEWNLGGIFHTLITIAWWTINMKMINLIISSCENTSEKADKFNKILYRLTLDDKTGELANNPKVKLHFANKRKVLFTACGFFNIDYTLASSMIAAGTTYLVILIQMDGSNK